MGQDESSKSRAQTIRLPLDQARELAALGATRRRFVVFVFFRDGVRSVSLTAAAPLVLGRDATADLQILDHSLSRRHASISLDGDHIVVEDLQSTNGTRVRGKSIEREFVAVGEEISLGDVVAFVHEISGKQTNSAGSLVSGVDTYDAFRDGLAQEVVRMRFFSRPLALVTIMAEGKSPTGSLRHVCARLRQEIRPVDRITLYSPESIELCLPEMDLAAARALLHTLLQSRADEPPLLAGVALFPGAADTPDKLLEVSRQAVRQATSAERVYWAADRSTWTRKPSETGETTPTQGLVAESPRTQEILTTATRLARSAIPVLLLGETGTGKEVLARVIHDASPRKDAPMVVVNCAAIPQQLVESTLFGHEKGAFTGAVAQHKGVFEAAAGGTVFLDEIGELPPATQAALLRVLEVRKICRVGSTREIPVDTRIVAATHRDLEGMVETGAFRADLLYRLNTMTLRIPPLRSRREDIPLLAERFLEMAQKNHGVSVRHFDPAAINLLMNYGWPGNVRELRNAVERAAVIAIGNTIHCLDLPERVRASGEEQEAIVSSANVNIDAMTNPSNDDDDDGIELDVPALVDETFTEGDAVDGSFRDIMRKLEAEVLLRVLRDSDGNQTQAAKKLDLPRRTFQYKMKQLGIRRLGYAVHLPKRS